MTDGAFDGTKTMMEYEQYQMQQFEHYEHEIDVHQSMLKMPSASKGKDGYHKDPTHPAPYRMDRVKYEKLIKENLEMNKNLITTPSDERYHLRLRTANKDLSSINDNHRIKDWDARVSPTKYKAFKNCAPGSHGAPYDYRKYLPEADQ